MLNNLLKLKKNLILILILIFINSVIFADISVAFFKLNSKNLNQQTSSVINNAILSFIKDFKNYRIVNMKVTVVSEKENLNQYDYIVTGEIVGQKNGIKLELILKNSSNEVIKTISKVYRNSNLILLDSRVLVSQLFDRSENLNVVSSFTEKNEITEALNNDFFAVTNVSILAGSWKGEDGIKRIEIMRGGKAIALLSSGASIFLKMTIDDGYLCVKQLSAPLKRQFINLPDEVAKKMAKLGKTPTWKLKVSSNNKILSGIKTDLQVEHNEIDIISSKEVKLPVSWYRK